MTDQHPRRSDDGFDVRPQLANDRTLLAWIRSVVALAGLGFVVARFGISVRELQGLSPGNVNFARYVGVALVGVALGALVLGVIQYRRVELLLRRDGAVLAVPRWPTLTISALCFLGIIALAIYLATQPT